MAVKTRTKGKARVQVQLTRAQIMRLVLRGMGSTISLVPAKGKRVRVVKSAIGATSVKEAITRNFSVASKTFSKSIREVRDTYNREQRPATGKQ